MTRLHNIFALVLLPSVVFAVGWDGFPLQTNTALTNWYDVADLNPCGQIYTALVERTYAAQIDNIGDGNIIIKDTFPAFCGVQTVVSTNFVTNIKVNAIGVTNIVVFTNAFTNVEQCVTNVTITNKFTTWTFTSLIDGSNYTFNVPITQFIIAQLEERTLNLADYFIATNVISTAGGGDAWFAQTNNYGNHPEYFPTWGSQTEPELRKFLKQAVWVGDDPQTNNYYGQAYAVNDVLSKWYPPLTWENWVMADIEAVSSNAPFVQSSIRGRMPMGAQEFGDASHGFFYFGTNYPKLVCSTTNSLPLNVAIAGQVLSNGLFGGEQILTNDTETVTLSAATQAVTKLWAANVTLTITNSVDTNTLVTLRYDGQFQIGRTLGLLASGALYRGGRQYFYQLDLIYSQLNEMVWCEGGLGWYPGDDKEWETNAIYSGQGNVAAPTSSWAGAKSKADGNFGIVSTNFLRPQIYTAGDSNRLHTPPPGSITNQYIADKVRWDKRLRVALTSNASEYVSEIEVYLKGTRNFGTYDANGENILEGYYSLSDTINSVPSGTNGVWSKHFWNGTSATWCNQPTTNTWRGCAVAGELVLFKCDDFVYKK